MLTKIAINYDYENAFLKLIGTPKPVPGTHDSRFQKMYRDDKNEIIKFLENQISKFFVRNDYAELCHVNFIKIINVNLLIKKNLVDTVLFWKK